MAVEPQKQSRAPYRKAIAKPKLPAESRFARSPFAYFVASVLLVVPCFWQSRIQAGDLSSHIYNTWLAQLIERGQAPGLSLASQSTNILFDWMLAALYRPAGPAVAQQLAVAIAVLAFAWGAFAFVCAVSGQRAWNILPWIGMLAYGWVFHMGFFGFYLSLGICFGALALLWSPDQKRVALAIPLIPIAYLAHGLPVLWAAGILGYTGLARRFGARNQWKLLGGSLAAIVAIRFVLEASLLTGWSVQQFTFITGADQFWIFDSKYGLVFAAVLCLWGWWLLRLREIVAHPLFPVIVLTAATIALIPSSILIPGYKAALGFIAERMSLALAVCLCALLATAPPRAADRYTTAALSALFLIMLFRDELLLNRFEDRIEAAVAQLPPMKRVISGIGHPPLRVGAIVHMIDRVCVERCFSYANYEPSTAAFRVRAGRENSIVAATYADSFALQIGTYVIQERDLPIYQILVDESGQVTVRIPPAGSPCGMTQIDLL